MRLYTTEDNRRLWVTGNKPFPYLYVSSVRCFEDSREIKRIDSTRNTFIMYFSSSPEVDRAKKFFLKRGHGIRRVWKSNKKYQELFFPEEFVSLFSYQASFDKTDCIEFIWKDTFSPDLLEFMKKYRYKTYWSFEENPFNFIIKG